MATVKNLLPIAAQDLRIVKEDDPISKATDLLTTARNRMLVVDNENEELIGVITRADILRAVHCDGAGPEAACGHYMSSSVKHCQVEDRLIDVWSQMSAQNLNAMPITDGRNNALGVLSSKCVLVKMLAEAHQQDQLMRDYVNGMGYHS